LSINWSRLAIRLRQATTTRLTRFQQGASKDYLLKTTMAAIKG
jgi:hypothetical protein